jgi:hypothetical protein
VQSNNPVSDRHPRLIEPFRLGDPVPDVSGPSMRRFVIDSKGVTRTEVAKGTGLAVATIREILAGQRGLGRKHIEAFARDFHVEPGALLAEPKA